MQMEENQQSFLPRPLPCFFDNQLGGFTGTSNRRQKMSDQLESTTFIAQPEGTPFTLGNHPTTVTPPSAHGEPSVASELGVLPANTTAPCGISIAEPQTVDSDTFRARLLFCTLLDEDPTFMLESFNTYARMKPGEAAAALEAMARGDGETRQGMAVLLKNLYRFDKRAAINLFSLILRQQSSESSLENPTIVCQAWAATYVGCHASGIVNLALTYFIPLRVRRWVGI